MAKNKIIKTQFTSLKGTVSQSFAVVKRKLFKRIKADIEEYLETHSIQITDDNGEQYNFHLIGDIFNDDTMEVISVSKGTADELYEVFGLEFGSTSILELWASTKDAVFTQDPEEVDTQTEIDE